MILTEEVKFRGVNKQISPAAVDDVKNRMIVNPITDALNIRYLSSDSGDELIAEGIKGTTEIVNGSLPAGTNKCIGWCEDKQRNCIFYFIHNSNDDHSIFKYAPETDTITLIIQKSELNFQDDRRYLINSAGVIEDLLIWNDGINHTGYINTTRSYVYAGFEESHIRLIKKQPYTRPQVNPTIANDGHAFFRTTDSSLTVNLIADKNLQFSYRLIFLDDELSNLSQYSILSLGDRFPEHSTAVGVKIQVRITLANAIAYAKRIQVLYREGTLDTWKVFKNLDTTSGSTYDAYYTGSEFIEEVAESESSKIFESIPNFSESSCVQKNRLFVTENDSGFDVDTVPSITIAQITNKSENILEPGFVPGGTKKIGIAVFDEFQRSIGVVNVKQFTSSWRDRGIFLFPFITSHSFTSLTVGTGSKTWTLVDKELVKYAQVGKWIIAQPLDVAPTAFGMQGQITSKNASAGTITVNITSVTGSGSGTKASWVIKIATVQNTAIGDVDRFHNGIDVSLTGNFSSGSLAKYYSIVRSDELLYDEYLEVPVRPYFYKYEKTGNYSATSAERVFDGKVFTKDKPSSGDSYSKVYLQLPRELPLALDTSFFVRFTAGVGGSPTVEKVLEVDGDFAIVNNFSIEDWASAGDGVMTADNFIVMVAFYRLKQSEEITRYYEVTDRYPINSNGTIPTTSFPDLLCGDCYVMSNRYTFRAFKNLPAYQKKTNIDITVRSLSTVGAISSNVDRKPPKFGALDKLRRGLLAEKNIDELSDIKDLSKSANATERALDSFLGSRGAITVAMQRFKERSDNLSGKYTGDENDAKIKKILTSSDGLSAAARNFIIDYTKSDWNKGIVLIEIEKSKRVFTSDTKIRFSNKYIQDTRINGINSFDAGNAHSISSERGKIKRLIPIGNNILAVHERACTTLYIEEGIIRAADGGGSLVTTRNVIGHDNKMVLEYGAYHGESVAKNDLGHAFGFDVYKGIVWRYTNEGLASIVGDDMEDYFKLKSDEYLPIKDTCKIIGVVDYDNKEYILTFRKEDGSGETWAYNYKKNLWSNRYSFIPEMYASLGKTLLSFQDGKLWKHNVNSTYNNFYGVQYGRSVRVAVNPFPGTKKVFNGIVIGASRLSTDSDEIIVRCYCGGQETYMRLDEFDQKQGEHLASILRDINTPNIDAGKIALRDGDDLRGDYIEVEIITSLPERLPMSFFEITYNKSEFSK